MHGSGIERPDRLRGGVVRASDGGRPFHEDRGRDRRRLRFTAIVAGLCVYALLRVWLSTEVAACGSRITALERENKKLTTDLTVAQVKLDQRGMYGTVMIPAEQLGFGTEGERRIIEVPRDRPAEPLCLMDQVGSELRAGSRLILSEALAHDRQVGGRGRGNRP